MDWYDKTAGGYEELHREEQERKYEVILKQIEKGSVLDVGCGEGWLLEKIPGSAGIEPSSGLRKHPRSKEGSAENIPYPDKSFDVVVSVTALHHAEPAKAMPELLRVGKKQWILTILKKAKNAREWDDKIRESFENVKLIEDQHDNIYFCANPKF